MDKVFLILILVGGIWETEAISVTGELGGDATINCSHIIAHSNVKYFCKVPCSNENVLIRSDGKNTSKYGIKDKGNTFSVTISHLTEDDAGKYLCGIDRFGKDTFNEVVLTVTKGRTQEPDGDFSQSTIEKLVYIGTGLGVVLLALAVVLLIFFQHRNGDIGPSSGTYQNTDYASPSSLKGNNHNIINSSSSARDDETTDGTKTSCISSILSEQHQDTSREQSDDLFYSCVNFNTHADCSSVTPRSAVATYSMIALKATDESAVYCNV